MKNDEPSETEFEPESRDECDAPAELVDEDSTLYERADALIAADSDENWLGEDLEEAYLRALAANEAAETEIEADRPAAVHDHGDALTAERRDLEAGTEAVTVAAAADEKPAATPGADSIAPQSDAADQAPINAVIEANVPSGDEATSAAALPESHLSGLTQTTVTTQQVLEAVLFVGGQPLTTKKLSSLLRSEDSNDLVERTIAELNRQYEVDGRPYEICLGEGGYRMALRPEFDRIRHRVYGVGPKEVRLSQDVLEVLALVAYQQPISKQQIEETGKQNAGGLLRQLLRRELVAIERDDKDRKDVKYRTTSRFLSVFGLADLEELPRAEELNFK